MNFNKVITLNHLIKHYLSSQPTNLLLNFLEINLQYKQQRNMSPLSENQDKYNMKQTRKKS